jgi:hypothetical protein
MSYSSDSADERPPGGGKRRRSVPMRGRMPQTLSTRRRVPLQGVGRHSDLYYDPVTGQRRERGRK